MGSHRQCREDHRTLSPDNTLGGVTAERQTIFGVAHAQIHWGGGIISDFTAFPYQGEERNKQNSQRGKIVAEKLKCDHLKLGDAGKY